MFDGLTSSLTVFDAIAIAVIIASAIMALSRGMMRELITLIAMFIAGVFAFFAHGLFRDSLAAILPESAIGGTADALVVIIAFVIVYVIARMLGGRFASVIQGVEEVSIVDRLAGIIFGIARGYAALVASVWLIIVFLPNSQIPEFISGAATYPVFERSARALNANAPKIAEEMEDRFQPSPPTE